MFKIIGKAFLEKTRNTSISVDPNVNPRLSIYSIGNSHLDTAWLWRKSDTREKKIEPTFSRAIYHLKSPYFSNFTFTANSVVHYEWIRDDYPELFNEIQSLVEDGKWEFVGGDWVEMDVNLPDGESLIRQRLIGQRFNLKQFHKLADIAWYDDVFGFCQTLPQILAKSGAKYFYTNKFCYSLYSVNFPENSIDYAGSEKFPFFHFHWESLDGSRVLISWAQHKNNFNKHLKHFNLHSRATKPNDHEPFNYQHSWQEIDGRLSNEVIPLIVNAYGTGDGGMGPRPLEILEQMVWENRDYVRNSVIRKFFEALEPYRDRLPIWKDELYLEGHQGTLTSVGMIKENNHTAEILLHQVEVLSAISGLLGGDHFQDEFYEDWKIILFLQFHDVLPGSSIAEVYRDAAADYNSVFAHLASSQENTLMNIAHLLKAKIKNHYFTVFNPLGWERSGYITVNARNFNSVFDGKTAPLLCQRVAFSPYVINREVQLGMDSATGTDYNSTEATGKNSNKIFDYEANSKDKLLIFLPKNAPIPSYGISNIGILEASDKTTVPNIKWEDIADEFVFRSKILVKINKISGRIVHISKDKTERNILGSFGIGYRLYSDEKTQFDAWNLDPDYSKKPLELPPIDSIIVEEEGPLRFTLLIRHASTSDGTQIHTRISLYHGQNIIYGETLINWQEEWKLLKLVVDTKFNSTKIDCGIPYGIQTRSTKPKTVYQKAMIEYAYQQFATWNCEENDGISVDYKAIAVYSQSKYGLWAHDGVAEFSFLKAAQFEKPKIKYATLDEDFEQRSKFIDRGFHRIPWAVEFFDEKPVSSTVVKHSCEYNTPMIVVPSSVEHSTESFFSIDSPNVIISTIKEIEAYQPEAPDWFYNPSMAELPFVIRCVEYDGHKTECNISLSPKFEIKNAMEVDLLERIHHNGINESNLKLESNSLRFSINPYEIKSILVIGKILLDEETLKQKKMIMNERETNPIDNAHFNEFEGAL